jgi:hypothetical protein
MEPQGEPRLNYYGESKRIEVDTKDSVWEISCLFNEGYKRARYNLMEIRGGDVIYSKDWFDTIFNHAKKEVCFAGYNMVYKLNQHETNEVMVGRKQNPSKVKFPVDTGGCGITFCLRKELLAQIGDWPEMNGYGYEDNIFSEKCWSVLGYYPYEHSAQIAVEHLYHPNTDGGLNKDRYKEFRKQIRENHISFVEVSIESTQ